MKKFNVIYFSDCRGCSEVNEVKSLVCESGRDVFRLVIGKECDNEDWVNCVSGMINSKDDSWVEDESRWDDIFCLGCEGDVESSEFNFSMCDEFRDVMVIRDDSKYFGKFKEGVSDRDDENVNLYYDILEELCK